MITERNFQMKSDTDIEAQHNNVVQGYPVANTVSSTPVRTTKPAPTTIYIIEEQPTHGARMEPMGSRPDTNPGMVICAIIGLSFSWIPIVGFVTFCANIDAPKGSFRQILASTACCISTFLFIFCFLFWPLWIYT